MQDTTSAKSNQQKEYRLVNSELTAFPMAKLYVLKGVESINLSRNKISSLEPLLKSVSNSQQAFKRLRKIDLSHNLFESTEILKPLSKCAPVLEQVKFQGNALTRQLNYLYDLMLMFPECHTIVGDSTLTLDSQKRQMIIHQQLRGGAIMSQFLRQIERQTKNRFSPHDLGRRTDFLQSQLVNLQTSMDDLTTQNQHLLQSMKSFIDNSSYNNRKQLDTRVQTNSSGLQSYLNQAPNHKNQSLIRFYYEWTLRDSNIQQMILNQLQVTSEEEQSLQRGTKEQLVEKMQQFMLLKWHKQHQSTKFIQDVAVGQPGKVFFALSSDWNKQTKAFLIHRYQSLLRLSLHPQSSSSRTFVSSPLLHTGSPLSQYIPGSPKNNKYCLQASVGFLQETVIKIAFRRIQKTHFIKDQDLIPIQMALSRVVGRYQAIAIRKIYKQALFMYCLEQKMNRLRMIRLFAAWRQVRKRRLKLVKKYLVRKNKRERALLSVFLTQWRMTSRHIRLSSAVKEGRQLPQRGKMIRSSTCSRLKTTGNRKK